MAVGGIGAALIISEKSEKLTAQESAAVIADLPDGKGENWEKVDIAPVAEAGAS